MSRRRVLTTLLAAAALLLGASTAAHAAATLAQVVRDFRADGAISACKYDVADLRRVRHDAKSNRALATKPFRKALRAAITQLKAGGCPTKAAPTATTPTTTTTTTTTATTPTTTSTAPQAAPAVPPPASGSGSGSGGSDAATVVLICAGALALALLLAALALALAARRGWQPEWALGARHTVGEAGYRVSATWADFRDWLRLGR